MLQSFLIVLSMAFLSPSSHAQSCNHIFKAIEEAPLPFPELLTRLPGLQSLGELKVKPMEARDKSDELPTMENLALKQLQEGTADLALKVAELYPKPVETVIYPTSGYDAATAFVIFPTARTVIGMDLQAFIGEGMTTIVPKLPHDSKSEYTGYNEAASYRFQGMAEPIIARLMESVPHFRLRGSGFVTTGEFPGPYTDLGNIRVNVQKRSSHGWVDFDSGPGTPLKRYIHIQTIFPTNALSPWAPRLEEHGYQGILIKGSMGVFTPKNRQGGGFFLLDHLKNEGGLVVDTDRTRGRSSGEMDPYAHVPSFTTVKEAIVGGSGPVDVSGSYLGYTRGTHVTEYVVPNWNSPTAPQFLELIK